MIGLHFEKAALHEHDFFFGLPRHLDAHRAGA